MRNGRNRKYQTARKANHALSALLIAGMIGGSTLTAFAEPDAVKEPETVAGAADEAAVLEAAEEKTEKKEAAAVDAAAETAEKKEETAEAAAEETAEKEEAAETKAQKAVKQEEESVSEGYAYDIIEKAVSISVTEGNEASLLTLKAPSKTFDRFMYLLDFDGSLAGMSDEELYDAILEGRYRTADAYGGFCHVYLTSPCTVYATAYCGVPGINLSFAENVASVEISPEAPFYTYETEEGTGARSATDAGGNVYLGGKYIELGLSKYGSFGTSHEEGQQTNFHNGWFGLNAPYAYGTSHLGLIVDGDGWNQGLDPTDGDFFAPGSPYEAWQLSYELDGEVHEEVKAYSVAYLYDDCLKGNWNQEPKTADTSDIDAGKLSAKTIAETEDGLKIEIRYEFDEDSKFYKTRVNLVNNSGRTLKNVKFARSFDPDQDQWFNGSFTTYNKVVCNAEAEQEAGAKNYSMIVARGNESLDGFFFLALDNRSVVLNNAWGVLDRMYWYDEEEGRIVYDYERLMQKTSQSYATDSMLSCSRGAENGYTLDDAGIGILFNLGDMEANGTDELQYYSSLDPDVAASYKEILVKEGLEINP